MSEETLFNRIEKEEKIIADIKKMMLYSDDILDVMEQIANIKYGDNIKTKVTIQEQDFGSNTNKTYEKIIK